MKVNLGLAIFSLLSVAMSMARPGGGVALEKGEPNSSGSAAPGGVSGSASPQSPTGSAPPQSPSGSATPQSPSGSASPSTGSSAPTSGSATPTTQTTTPSTPTASGPTATWTVVIHVGSSSFPVGNANTSTFEGMMDKACGPGGCDSGSPQHFPFSYIGGGKEPMVGPGTGTFVMSGVVDNNQNYTSALVQSINAALIKSASCSQKEGTSCPSLKRDPQCFECPPPEGSCTTETMNQCTVVNFISATMWEGPGIQGSTISMSGSSETPQGWDCNAFWGIINGGLPFLDLPSPAAGIVAVAQLASCPPS